VGVAHACERYPVERHFQGKEQLGLVWKEVERAIPPGCRVDSQRISINLVGSVRIWCRIIVQKSALKVTWLSKTENKSVGVTSIMCHCQKCELGKNTWKNAVRLGGVDDVSEDFIRQLTAAYTERNSQAW